MLERESEVLKPQPLSRLNVLVHARFLGHTQYSLYDEDYQRATHMAYVENAPRFLPASNGQLLLFMPNFQSYDSGKTPQQKFRKYAKGAIRFKRYHSKAETWVDLYHQLKNSAPIRNNVQLVHNVPFSDCDGNSILKRAEDLGFEINSKTDIVVSGEWTDLCVDTTVHKLLGAKGVNIVKVDRKTTINEKNEPAFIGSVGFGYDYRYDNQYLYVNKRKKI